VFNITVNLKTREKIKYTYYWFMFAWFLKSKMYSFSYILDTRRAAIYVKFTEFVIRYQANRKISKLFFKMADCRRLENNR